MMDGLRGQLMERERKKNHEEMRKKIVEIMDGREKQKIEQMTKNEKNKQNKIFKEKENDERGKMEAEGD